MSDPVDLDHEIEDLHVEDDLAGGDAPAANHPAQTPASRLGGGGGVVKIALGIGAVVVAVVGYFMMSGSKHPAAAPASPAVASNVPASTSPVPVPGGTPQITAPAHSDAAPVGSLVNPMASAAGSSAPTTPPPNPAAVPLNPMAAPAPIAPKAAAPEMPSPDMKASAAPDLPGATVPSLPVTNPANIDAAASASAAPAAPGVLPVVNDAQPPSASQLAQAPAMPGASQNSGAPAMPSSAMPADIPAAPGVATPEAHPSGINDISVPMGASQNTAMDKPGNDKPVGPSVPAEPVGSVGATSIDAPAMPDTSANMKVPEVKPAETKQADMTATAELTAKIKMLEEKVAAQEDTIRQLRADAATKAPEEHHGTMIGPQPGVAGPVGNADNIDAASEVPKKATTHKTAHHAAAPHRTPAVNWVLKGAKPGMAWVVPKNGGSVRSVSVGEQLPGLGKITAIVKDSTGYWVVNGTKGRISQ